jgi:hypothetical protein
VKVGDIVRNINVQRTSVGTVVEVIENVAVVRWGCGINQRVKQKDLKIIRTCNVSFKTK